MSLISYLYPLSLCIISAHSSVNRIDDCVSQSSCLEYELVHNTTSNEHFLCLRYNDDIMCKRDSLDDLCFGCVGDNAIAPLPADEDNLCIPLDCRSDMARVAQFLIHDEPCTTTGRKEYVLDEYDGDELLDAYCYSSNARMCASNGPLHSCSNSADTNCADSCVWEINYNHICPDICTDTIKIDPIKTSSEWWFGFKVKDLCCGEIETVEVKDSGVYSSYILAVESEWDFWSISTDDYKDVAPYYGQKLTAPISIRVTNNYNGVLEFTNVCTDFQSDIVTKYQFACPNGPSNSGSDSDDDGDSDSSRKSKGSRSWSNRDSSDSSKHSNSDSGEDSDGNGSSDSESRSRKYSGSRRGSSSRSGSSRSGSKSGSSGSGSSGSKSGSGSGSSRGSGSDSVEEWCLCSQVTGAQANSKSDAASAFVSDNGSVNNVGLISMVIAFVIGVLCGVLFVGAYLWFSKKKTEVKTHERHLSNCMDNVVVTPSVVTPTSVSVNPIGDLGNTNMGRHF